MTYDEAVKALMELERIVDHYGSCEFFEKDEAERILDVSGFWQWESERNQMQERIEAETRRADKNYDVADQFREERDIAERERDAARALADQALEVISAYESVSDPDALAIGKHGKHLYPYSMSREWRSAYEARDWSSEHKGEDARG